MEGEATNQTSKSFIERENVANYIKQLQTEADPVKREVLAKLLDEEKLKQVSSNTSSWPFPEIDPT